MRPKQELLDEYANEGDDSTFLEVFIDLRDRLADVADLMEEHQKLHNGIVELDESVETTA